jgi:hypothetical protein
MKVVEHCLLVGFEAEPEDDALAYHLSDADGDDCYSDSECAKRESFLADAAVSPWLGKLKRVRVVELQAGSDYIRQELSLDYAELIRWLDDCIETQTHVIGFRIDALVAFLRGVAFIKQNTAALSELCSFVERVKLVDTTKLIPALNKKFPFFLYARKLSLKYGQFALSSDELTTNVDEALLVTADIVRRLPEYYCHASELETFICTGT